VALKLSPLRWLKRIVRRAVAAFFVFALVLEGVGNGIHLASGSHSNDAFLVVAATLGAALFYFLAYFVLLRDIVGGSISPRARSLRYRWSSLARSAAVVCVILMWLNELGDVFARQHLVWTFSTLFLSSLLIPTWVLATEEYFCLTMNEVASENSPLPGKWRWLGQLGTLLSSHIRGRSSIVLGGLLVFASLFFPMELMGSWTQMGHLGRQILFELGPELRSVKEYWGGAEYWADQIGRGMYALALILALATLFAVSIGKRGNRMLGSRVVLIAVGAIALFGVVNFTMSWTLFAAFYGFPYPVQLTYFVWATLWLLPVVLWRWRSHKAVKSWDHTRVAVCVLQLPIVFFLLGALPYQSQDTGYLFFLFGTQFLWWGYLTSATKRSTYSPATCHPRRSQYSRSSRTCISGDCPLPFVLTRQ